MEITETFRIIITSDSDQYNHWMRRAGYHIASAPGTRQVKEGTWNEYNAARFGLSDEMKEFYTLNSPIEDESLMRAYRIRRKAIGYPDLQLVYMDLMTFAIDSINWQEVADHFIDAHIAEHGGQDGL